MTELKATGLVQMEETKSNDGYNTTFMITLKSEFDWFPSDEFMVLKSGGGRKKNTPYADTDNTIAISITNNNHVPSNACIVMTMSKGILFYSTNYSSKRLEIQAIKVGTIITGPKWPEPMFTLKLA